MAKSVNNSDAIDSDNIYDELYTKIISGEISTHIELHRAKIELCKEHKLPKVPSNTEILEHAPEHIYELVLPLLKLKPMRTMSGVAPVAVMTSPENCPHGRCSYCPGGVQDGTAQSYTGHEPAALRAGTHSFGPYHQTRDRLKQLETIGHPTDKIDLIIMGGTFTARSEDYQYWFIKRCFDALNLTNAPSLNDAHLLNELARHRCIGLTIETRPDMCGIPQVTDVLKQGGTRIELGVQTLNDDVLKSVKRGHGKAETRTATKLLKDAGLKVCYHLMPNLPGMTPESDLEMFLSVFEDPDYRPDMIKIYPTLVVKGTELYEQWKSNEYKPYTLDETIDLTAKLKAKIPSWVRIQRVQRDIPAKLIEAGVRKSNLRQLVQKRLSELGERCRCIRCREVGQNLDKGTKIDEDALELRTDQYDAAGGTESFISVEDTTNDLLIAFVRLRKPGANIIEKLSQPALPDGAGDFAFVRELKVFGQLVPILKAKAQKKGEELWQHRGYGKMLMEAAEKHAAEQWDTHTILVNAGVGARKYYSNLDYTHHGHYMIRHCI
jgi:elongator complex protein 3